MTVKSDGYVKQMTTDTMVGRRYQPLYKRVSEFKVIMQGLVRHQRNEIDPNPNPNAKWGDRCFDAVACEGSRLIRPATGYCCGMERLYK